MASSVELTVRHGATNTTHLLSGEVASTHADVYQICESVARERLGPSVAVQLYAGNQKLSRDSSAISGCMHVECIILSRPRLLHVEPLCGPEHGSTTVFIHGTGFDGIQTLASARVRFGAAEVALERLSDSILRCRTPAHPAGIVAVALVRCEDDADTADDTATFQFVRLEAAYDTIFATTNSFCPLRGSRSMGPGTAQRYSNTHGL